MNARVQTDADDVGAMRANTWHSCGKRLRLRLRLNLFTTVNTWNDCNGWQSCDDAKEVIYDNRRRAPLFVRRSSMNKMLDPQLKSEIEINSS